MILTNDQRLVFTPTDQAKFAFDNGGVPIRYGDVLQLLQQLTDENARLKSENERLWKIAENKSSALSTVVVQTPSQPQPDPNAEARRQMQLMLMKSLLTSHPIPQVQTFQPLPRTQTNCVTRYIGTTAYTDCN